jgi:hypothetical protein
MSSSSDEADTVAAASSSEDDNESDKLANLESEKVHAKVQKVSKVKTTKKTAMSSSKYDGELDNLADLEQEKQHVKAKTKKQRELHHQHYLPRSLNVICHGKGECPHIRQGESSLFLSHFR